MEGLRLAAALLLPWVVGATLARTGWCRNSPGSWAGILGYGYILGVLLTAAVMLGLDAVGAPQSFPLISGILVVVAVVGFWVTRMAPCRHEDQRSTGFRQIGSGLFWRRMVVVFLLGALMVRFGGFALEIIWRPLYPWDAWMNWAPKALVWFDHKSLIPYVSAGEWLSRVPEDAYTGSTRDNWKYPPLVPLAQLWIALALDRWDESLINLPWLFAGIALILAFYGQMRAFGAGPLLSVVFCYLLVSMPFLGTHVALGGYAELWVAVTYALAVMAFLRWAVYREHRQGALALVLVMALPFIKQPGLAWSLTLLPALVVAVLPGRWILPGIVALAVAAGAVYFTVGIEFSLPRVGQIVISSNEIRLPGYRGEGFRFYPVWDPFIKNFFVLANWHLFWFLAPIVLMLAPVLTPRREIAVASILVWTGLGFLFLVFFFTGRYSNEALSYVTLNRAVLHMVPALTFVMAFMLLRLFQGMQNPKHQGLTSF